MVFPLVSLSTLPTWGYPQKGARLNLFGLEAWRAAAGFSCCGLWSPNDLWPATPSSPLQDLSGG